MRIELSEDLNLTLTNFSEVRMIDENFFGSALMLVNYFIMEVFGNGMLIVMILYERFAMDPQKRFVNNMLLSCLCLTAILANVIPLSGMTYCVLFDRMGKLFSNYFIFLYPVLILAIFRPSLGTFDYLHLCRNHDFSSTFVRRNCHYQATLRYEV